VEAIEGRGADTLLHVRVQPKASRNELRIENDGRIRVALTAPPVEGAANKALCEFLAKQLGCAKCAVTLEAGGKSREKTVRIAGVGVGELRQRLGA
jgi:uncharacterized protein (TIGR00251 family)